MNHLAVITKTNYNFKASSRLMHIIHHQIFHSELIFAKGSEEQFISFPRQELLNSALVAAVICYKLTLSNPKWGTHHHHT